MRQIRLGLLDAVGDGGVGDEAFFHAYREDFFHHLAQAFALLRRQFDQRVPLCGVGERIAAAGAVLEHQLDAAPGHDLERGDAARGALGGDAEQLQRRFGRFDAGKRGLDRARPRH